MSKNDTNPEEPPISPDLSSGKETLASAEQISAPASGRRQALSNVRRQLTDEELSQTGTQKMLLEMLEEAENEKENLKSYVTSFHEADKKASVLGEKLKADRAMEILFGVGVGLGGAIFGLAPYFWDANSIHGILCLIIGLVLTISASIGRAVKK